MSFVETLKAASSPIWQEIHTMPFNAELTAGTLPKEVFRSYIIQDAHYLEGFARGLAIAASRAPNSEIIGQLSASSNSAAVVEATLHGEYMQLFDVTREDFLATPRSQVCDHYMNSLIATVAVDPFPVGVAALLPCFWVYHSVGQQISKVSTPNNPYQAWIDTYASEEFSTAVEGMLSLTNQLAETADEQLKAKMTAAFKRAVWHEWMFWSSAYHQLSWPEAKNET